MDTTKFNETDSLLDDETLEGMIRFQRAVCLQKKVDFSLDSVFGFQI